LKVSIRTLQEWRDTGVIPYIQIKGKIIYRESDIERLLQTYYNKERQE
ncbi:helix-turn-helix domain-containing protein, partial [Bacteroides ovatus]